LHEEVAGTDGMPADTSGCKSRRPGAELYNRQEAYWAKRASKRDADTGTHEDGRRLVEGNNKQEFY